MKKVGKLNIIHDKLTQYETKTCFAYKIFCNINTTKFQNFKLCRRGGKVKNKGFPFLFCLICSLS